MVLSSDDLLILMSGLLVLVSGLLISVSGPLIGVGYRCIFYILLYVLFICPFCLFCHVAEGAEGALLFCVSVFIYARARIGWERKNYVSYVSYVSTAGVTMLHQTKSTVDT